jgi:hypothetical protein
MSNTSRSSFDHTEHFNFVIVLIESGVHQLPSIASLKRLCEQWPSLQIKCNQRINLLKILNYANNLRYGYISFAT